MHGAPLIFIKSGWLGVVPGGADRRQPSRRRCPPDFASSGRCRATKRAKEGTTGGQGAQPGMVANMHEVRLAQELPPTSL